MGISDDIKPTRNHHYSRPTHNSHERFSYDDELGLEEEFIPYHKPSLKEMEKLEDDFFNEAKINLQPQKETVSHHKNHHKRGLSRIVIWLLAAMLATILVWQNFSLIKSFFKEKFSKENSVSSQDNSLDTKDEYYTGEKTPDTKTETKTSTETSDQQSNESTTQTSSTPANPINKADITIKVLNGNGIQKSGDKVKAELEQAGFKISRTANAQNFNYQSSIIYYKSGKDQEANLVKGNLKSKETTLEANDSIVGTYDIVIVVGAK